MACPEIGAPVVAASRASPADLDHNLADVGLGTQVAIGIRGRLEREHPVYHRPIARPGDGTVHGEELRPRADVDSAQHDIAAAHLSRVDAARAALGANEMDVTAVAHRPHGA